MQQAISKRYLSLLAAGSVMVASALAAGALGLVATTGFGWMRAALLIAGGDLLVVALAVDSQRGPVRDAGDDLPTVCCAAIAEGLMTFAITASGAIALFGNSKPVERLVYFGAALVIVPLCVVLAWRGQHRAAAERRRFLAVGMIASTACALCLGRLLGPLPDDTIGTSLFVLLELVSARAALTLCSYVLPTTWLRWLSPTTALAATPILLVVCVAAFIPSATFSALNLAVPIAGSIVAFCLCCAMTSSRFSRTWHLSRTVTHAIDAGVLVMASLIVFYVGSLSPEAVENHNFYLGPTLDVLHGHPMLIDTFSQYGVGVIYALVAIFLVIPIGYGAFALVLSAATVLLFAVVYATLRRSTGSVLLAATGLVTVIVLDLFGQIGFYVDYPSTGVLRFGLPWLVICCSVFSATTVRFERPSTYVTLGIVAIAAIWSGECGVYCLGTATALAGLNAAIMEDAPIRERARASARRVAALIAACAVGLIVFTLVMRTATGAWPDWGGYLEYIQRYTIGNFGDLLIEPWSPGIAIGGLYTISAIALVLVVAMRPTLVREHAAAFRAATGLTALGILVYTYFLGRSHPNNVVHVAPPAVALVFVWLGIARSTCDERFGRAAIWATAVFFGAIAVMGESADIDQKFPATALAAALGTTTPPDSGLRTLWHNPIAYPPAAQIALFVRSLGVRHTSLTVLLPPALETEVLLRLDAASAVGSSNPAQEALSTQASARAAAAVRRLRPGGLLILSSEELLPAETYASSLLRQRFALREVGASTRGVRAFSMIARE